MIYASVKTKLLPHKTAIFIAALILLALPFLSSYLNANLALWLSLLSAPIVLKVKDYSQRSSRYLFPAIILFIIFGILKMKIFLFIGIGCSLFFIIESREGKMGLLPLAWLALASPVPAYLVTVFTFPLRLQLSKITASLLSLAGKKVELSGNLFFVNGEPFSVDPVCIGLNTFITGLVLVTLFLAFAEQKKEISFSVPKLALLYVLTLLLLVLANFMRLLILVYLRSAPETLGHEMIGMGSLFLYVLLPMYFLINYYSKKESNSVRDNFSEKGNIISVIDPPKSYVNALPFALVLASSILSFYATKTSSALPVSFPKIFQTAFAEDADMQRGVDEKDVFKMQNEDMLVYIKAPIRWWGAEHNPTICWQGSGFKFKHIRQAKLQNQGFYFAEMENGDQKLYTCWWYSNGQKRSIDQLEWRSDMLAGAAPFFLVNVTSSSPEKLQKAVLDFFEETGF